ncbi:hypothetical protein ZWY2020_036826 [Hordeum vulgare]|nr:hypothetical protein ZWY2020_036826 [Hordeum vulgare]
MDLAAARGDLRWGTEVAGVAGAEAANDVVLVLATPWDRGGGVLGEDRRGFFFEAARAALLTDGVHGGCLRLPGGRQIWKGERGRMRGGCRAASRADGAPVRRLGHGTASLEGLPRSDLEMLGPAHGGLLSRLCVQPRLRQRRMGG